MDFQEKHSGTAYIFCDTTSYSGSSRSPKTRQYMWMFVREVTVVELFLNEFQGWKLDHATWNSRLFNYLGHSFFVSRLLGPRVCGRQEKKNEKKTLSTRGCSFRVPLNTRGCLTRTPHGTLKGTKARTRTEHTLYTIPGCTTIHLMQMSDSVPFGVMYY